MPDSGNSSQLFGGSRWVTNARHLPAFVAPSINIKMKTSTTTEDTLTSATGFNALALRGAQTSITAADTWATIANVSASGFFVAAVSPTHSASHTPSVRITVDGVVYTFTPSAAQASPNRLVVGYMSNGSALFGTSGAVFGANSWSDGGFESALLGGYPVLTTGTLSFITPEAALMQGLPLLRFENSLLIEAKCSLLSATASHKLCGAIYRVDV